MREVTPQGFVVEGYKFSSVGSYILSVKVTLLCHCSGVLARCRVIDGGIKNYGGFMCGAIMWLSNYQSYLSVTKSKNWIWFTTKEVNTKESDVVTL
jgi:hypothetical protein